MKALEEVNSKWVTEAQVQLENYPWSNSKKVFGIRKRIIAADLGTNARSLSRSRRRARYESYLYRYASVFASRFEKTTFGSLPSQIRLPDNILELNLMHIQAVQLFLQGKKEWGLFLEDDSVFSEIGLKQVGFISAKQVNRPTWINLNDGAQLFRTSSDPLPDANGLFRVIPPNTRCSSAYMINRKYALKLNKLIGIHGLPDWLPIDVIYQVANRKISAKSYWSEPVNFIQGSSSGKYLSNFASLRIKKTNFDSP